MSRFMLLLASFSLACAPGQDGPGEDEFAEHLLECDVPQPCEVLSYQSYAPPNPESLPSPAQLQCAIDAVDARQPALLVVSDGCEGFCGGDLYLIRSDGTALRQWWSQDDGTISIPGFDGSTVGDWSMSGKICDLVEAGTCTPQTCDHPSDWFVNCRDQDTSSCVP